MNYAQDIEIDVLSLDKEWQFQPKLFLKYAQELADKRNLLARAQERRDVIEAEANDRARKRLTVPDQKPPTVDAIKAAVIMDEQVKEVSDDILQLKHEADILDAAVTAFEHRKRALENLVTLHGQKYFSGPSVPLDIGREFVKKIDDTKREEARTKTIERASRRT